MSTVKDINGKNFKLAVLRFKNDIRNIPEYIDKLPENVFEIKNYKTYSDEVYEFNRYWWDADKCRIIMKLKRGNKYKVVKPIFDKNHGSNFVHFFDITDNDIWVNYDWIVWSNSIGYYLQ